MPKTDPASFLRALADAHKLVSPDRASGILIAADEIERMSAPEAPPFTLVHVKDAKNRVQSSLRHDLTGATARVPAEFANACVASGLCKPATVISEVPNPAANAPAKK